MILRSVRLENFRAVKSASVTFEPTPVLIGENDCGRSSVMEAIALALGWNYAEGEFRFQPFHAHRGDGPAAISITLEFGESTPGEWDSDGFAVLRSGFPNALGDPRHFCFEVTCGEGATRWVFGSAGQMPLVNDRGMLDWLRRRMPVFWMTEGMLGVRPAEASTGLLADPAARELADLVSRQYRDLLAGTSLDVSATIEAGSLAARQLLLDRVTLLPDRTTAMSEVLEHITGKRKARGCNSEAPPGFGGAAHKIGVLLSRQPSTDPPPLHCVIEKCIRLARHGIVKETSRLRQEA